MTVKPAGQETMEKCLEAFKKAAQNIKDALAEYLHGDDSLAEGYLQDAEHTINEIRTLMGRGI